MISKNKSILAAAVLSVLSTGVNAKVYPDQIVRDNLGEDVCRTDYRPLDHYEAQEHRDFLMQQMGKWDIVGLEGNWVIMGPGYHGEVKQTGPNNITFCYPINDHSEIPSYPTKSVEEGDVIDVEYNLTHDQNDFVRPLSYLAHYLGYAWVGGNNSQYVGEDMVINRRGDQWIIEGNNNGSCSGYRCDEKTQIIVDNFAFNASDENFTHGEVNESEKELVKTVWQTVENNTDIEQSYSVTLKLVESQAWSKTNNYGFSEAVSVENQFKWPLVGETKVNIKLEANQSFGEQNGGSSSVEVWQQANPVVPPHSKVQVKIDLWRSSISYPYQFNADMSYDVEFYGFLRTDDNAWHTHPHERPYLSHTFTMGRASENSANIPYQWDHRYIPGEVKWWDWSWAIQHWSLGSMQYATGASLRPFHSFVSGDFHADSSYSGEIVYGKPIPIDDDTLSARSSIEGDKVTTTDLGPLKVTTNFDADELSDLGFEGAELDIRLDD
ncbi:aerolysin family beta-barrel pore-forming toxin [Vibrio campbellii]|uniref:aerolysin family beta-barrel pore-forming toxin n=1 Tax=Vibrio campbellii TaxID=680 RepID=UPI00026C5477|nr:aerolysin family beta-barrel pore-forming toxin [Vibrio campbellii]AXB32918.1 aerolysin family beta-barrel pore-forming toxin [Vibrio campbellii]